MDKEKRAFPRFNLQVDVAFRRLNAGESKKVSAKNISRGGMCVISDRPLKENDIVELDITLMDAGEKIHVTARVVWINEFHIGDSEQGKRFDVGVEFIDITDETLTRLNAFIFTLNQ